MSSPDLDDAEGDITPRDVAYMRLEAVRIAVTSLEEDDPFLHAFERADAIMRYVITGSREEALRPFPIPKWKKP